MSEDELNWNHEDFDYSDISDADSYGDDYSEYESDGLDDIWYPEFGFDEETYLFEYDPTTHVHYDPNYPVEPSTSYQLVFTKTEMLSKLLGAWQKRSISNLQEEFSDTEYSHFDVNLYQMVEGDRAKLRSFSVRKFLEMMGGQEEVEKFRKKIDQTLILTKKILSSILARCLPMDLPYPALRNILSHLLREEGLHMMGFMSSDDEVEKVNERFHLSFLDDHITYLYYYVKRLMFNSFSVTVSNSTMYLRYMMKKFDKHLDKLSVMAEKMDSGGEKVEEIVPSEEREIEPE